MTALSLLARTCGVLGVMLIVDGLYLSAAADLDSSSLLLAGLFVAYVAVSVKGARDGH